MSRAKNRLCPWIHKTYLLNKRNGFLLEKQQNNIIEEIKEDNNIASIPVVVLTNLESSRDIDKMLALGASTYLVKANYSLDEAVAKIKEALN